MHSASLRIKRCFDVAASATGLAVLGLPILCTAAIMGKITNNTPFFLQTRIGKAGKPFRIIKIRTMRDEFNEAGFLKPDPERTPLLGAWLRKTRFDEAPQLLNVLKGEMSIVGPRPQIIVDPRADDEKRHSVLPGLTGLAQVRGANVISFDKTIELDHLYVDSATLLTDIRILAETPIRIGKALFKPHYRAERCLKHHV